MMRRSSPIHFYILTALLFFADISLATFFDQYLIATLISVFCIVVLYSYRITQLAWVIFLLSCESLIFHGRFGLALIYIIPVILLAQSLRKVLLMPHTLPYLTLLACLTTETFLIEHVVLGWPLVSFYTGIKMCGSLIVQYLILKYAF